jgi:hypothetical protein
MAADQRYCLSCGHRRGDPRLPFMDAVVFMDAVKRPARGAPPAGPPAEKRPRISANASLIAGIATLVLAIGVGVLIGRSGEQGTTSAATPPPVQVVKVGGGSEEAATAAKAKTTTGGGAAKAKTKKQKGVAQKEAETHPAAEEVLKPTSGVKLAPPKVQVGGKCEKGTAGCGKSGKFEGNFFGE